MPLAWSNALSTGIPAIDADHRELLARMNGLAAGMRDKREEGVVIGLITFLEDYVVEHFGREERLMQEHGFRGSAGHKIEHEAFIRDVRRLKSDCQRNGASPASAALLNLKLGTWLVNHIMRRDREFGEFLKAKSVTAGVQPLPEAKRSA